MAELKRSKLVASVNEASALLPVQSERLLHHLGAEQAWWVAHDEPGLKGVVSILHVSDQEPDKKWCIATTKLVQEGRTVVTDAEALASADGFVFVFGSSFLGAKGRLDLRRSFVARFQEDAVTPGKSKKARLSAPAMVMNLGTTLIAAFNEVTRTSEIQLLEAKPAVGRQMKRAASKDPGLDEAMQPLNIEGATFAGDDLVLGLRWPVSASGEPLLAVLAGARAALTSNSPNVDDLRRCELRVVEVGVGGDAKRPAGIRGIAMTRSVQPRLVDMISGPTDRALAANKAGSAPTLHVRLDLVTGETQVIQTFEGYRKVEGLAPTQSGGWIYALDDEEAIVLLASDET